MLECPAVPNIFLNRHIRNYQRRILRKRCPESVVLSMKKEPQRNYLEKIDICNTPVIFSEISQVSRASSQVQCTSPKRQARVLPNILRNSISKTLLESETSFSMAEANSTSGQSAIPDHLRGTIQVDAGGTRRQNRKRKQDYKQANIRQDPSDSLGIKHTINTAGMQGVRGSKMARLSMDKKLDKEMLKSKESDSSENTEVAEYNTSLAIPQSEMPVSDTPSSANQFRYPNEHSFFNEKEETYYDEFIDFASNDIFSKCYYDSYSKQSLEISLELNERLDDIQSILDWSFNHDTSVEQYQINNNIANEEMIELSNYVPQLGDTLPKCDLPPEELGWLNEWLSGKEMQLDAIFENNHIRENFNLSAERYNCNCCLQDDTSTDWNEALEAPTELKEDFSNFMELNISLSDEEKNKILESDELAEILMKEIDEIDTTDLLRSMENDQARSCEELTEIMLSALMDEAYPYSQNSVNTKASEKAEGFSNITADINDKQSEEATAYSNNNNNNNDKDDEEIREEEAYCSSGSDTGEELEYIVDSCDDSTDSSEAPTTSDINSNSSANDAEQNNQRSAAPLRKSKRKKPKKSKKELYECSMCTIPLRFRYLRTLKLHMEAAHKGLYDLLCETCGRRFNKQYTYNRHVGNCRRLKGTFQCHECGKEYRHKSSLVAHRRSKHEKDDEIESRKHVCTVCSKTFTSTARYNNHVKSHKNDW